MKFLRICEWDSYQHYKDRNPQWIKLHVALLTSHVWWAANDSQKALLVTVMLMAARHGNNIPADPRFVKAIGYLETLPNLDWLVEVGFCEYSDFEERRQSPWPSRYVPEDVRKAVLERDGYKCLACGAIDDLEIDHIIPVSKGGTGVIDNLQTLCVSCNRKKRVCVATATQIAEQRSLEKSREENKNPKTTRAHKLPEDFTPKAQHYDLAKQEGVIVDVEFPAFRDHFLGNGVTKLDWDRTFNNWIRNAKKYGGGRNGTDRRNNQLPTEQHRRWADNQKSRAAAAGTSLAEIIGHPSARQAPRLSDGCPPALEGEVKKVSR